MSARVQLPNELFQVLLRVKGERKRGRRSGREERVGWGKMKRNKFRFGCSQPRASASATKIMPFLQQQWAESFGEGSELFGRGKNIPPSVSYLRLAQSGKHGMSPTGCRMYGEDDVPVQLVCYSTFSSRCEVVRALTNAHPLCCPVLGRVPLTPRISTPTIQHRPRKLQRSKFPYGCADGPWDQRTVKG